MKVPNRNALVLLKNRNKALKMEIAKGVEQGINELSAPVSISILK